MLTRPVMTTRPETFDLETLFATPAVGRDATTDRIAVIEGDRTYSAQTLAADVALARRSLIADGAGAGAHVPLVAAPTYADIVRVGALFSLRATAMLLHPRWSAAEREWMIGASTVEASTVEANAPGHRALRPEANDWIATLIATSGTSAGMPRWVALSSRALGHAVAASAARLGWRSDDRWLLSLPLAHIGGLSIVLRCLAAQKPIVIADATTPDATREAIEQHRVTLLSLVPTQLGRLLEGGGAAPSSLRAVLVGGAKAQDDLLRRARDRGWPVLATYGATEACSQIATWVPDDPRSHRGCGPPLDGTTVRIADDGLIEVRSRGLMDGYVPLDGPQPFTADSWLRTSDLGRLDDDGNLHILGRADDVIISGGENVQPAEVESALLAHPGIREALVFGIADADWGQTVAAALVATSSPLDDDTLLAHCRVHLGGFKRPRRIAWTAALPTTEAGKADRRAARDLALRPLPSAKR